MVLLGYAIIAPLAFVLGFILMQGARANLPVLALLGIAVSGSVAGGETTGRQFIAGLGAVGLFALGVGGFIGWVKGSTG